MNTITVTAKLGNLDSVLEFMNDELEAHDCSMKLMMQLAIVVEELFVNIAHYAYAPGEGEVAITVDASDGFMMRFEDSGVPYNPLEKDDPDITVGVEDRDIGGLGIFMSKKMMDSMEYEYVCGKNVLTIRKAI